jgi:hypothetical protein
MPDDPADDQLADRLTGGDDEGDAWAQAFLGGQPEPAPPAEPPLTPDELATLEELMFAAKERGDDASVLALSAMSDDPAAFRKMIADATS